MALPQRKDARPQQDKEQNLPRVVVGDRFITQYDPVKALSIVERLADGETLNKICRGVAGMPAPTTFKRWVVNNPDLAKALSAAIVMSAQSLEEEALDTARAIAAKPVDGSHVRGAEVKIKQLQWSAERRDASKFGQRNQINLKVPVQIITTLNLGEGDSLPAESIYTLDLTPTSPQLVEERPVRVGGPLGKPSPRGPQKRVLTPRNPFYETRPHGKDAVVRTESSKPGDQEGQRRDGSPGQLDRPIPQQNPSQQEVSAPEDGEVK